MRLLALRGANLASLAEPFDIDFTVPPLQGAGIFAITGPTGAGKSTLLDAVCLALYDQLPRLDGAEAGLVTSESGPQQRYDDVRGILRQGAGRGYAEVDFIGQDRRRYRARWDVNRARDRAGERLQNQRMMLRDLDTGAVIGDRKTETLAAIETRVGLSFAQFRRAVLLAQGEFDSFIRARARDRAELLEKITATAIYSRLSVAAYQRARAAHDEIDAVERQAGAQRPLDEAAREDAARRLALARAALRAGQVRRASLDRDATWHRDLQAQQADLARAQAILDAAVQAEADAQPAQLAWSRASQAWGLREEYNRAAQFAVRRDAKSAELADGLATQASAEAASGAARQVAAEAERALTQMEAEYAASGPELDRAQRLDVTIESATRDLGRCAADRESADKNLQEQTGRLQTSRTTQTSLQAELARDEQWLADRPVARVLAARLDEVLGLLDQRAAQHDEVTRSGRLADADQELATKTAAAADALAVQLAAVERELHAATACLQTAETAAAAFDAADQAKRRNEIRQRLLALAHAGRAERDHAAAASASAEADGEQDRLRTEASGMSDELAAVAGLEPAALARVEEATLSLHRSETAASDTAARLRAQLVPGEACPVCGATDHVWMQVDAELQARARQDRQRVTELGQAAATLRDRRVTAEARLGANGRAAAACRRRGEQAVQARTRAASEWRQAADAASLEGPIDATAVQLAAEAAELVRHELDAALAENLKQHADARALNESCSALRRRQERHALALAAEHRAHQGAFADARLHTQDRQNATSLLAAGQARLDAILEPGWRQWPDPREACRLLAASYTTISQRHERLRDALARLRETIFGGEATLAAARDVLDRARTAEEASAAVLAHRRAERALVLGGREVETVRAGFEALRDATQRRREAAAQALGTAEQHLARAQGQAHALDASLRQLTADAAAATSALDDALQRTGLDASDVQAAIAIGEAGLNAEQARLDMLRQGTRQATTLLDERRRLRDRHLEADHSDLDAASVAAALIECATQLDAAEHERAEADAILRADDELTARVAALLQQAAALREAAQVWDQLDALIGSAAGDKFRRHAQSLTLQHLVGLANAHLADLAPRYALERAGGDMMLQVVDHDMADEARGLHNLSGGERFLVSLALALGLATMSTGQGVRVETLFIDEGFGALDGQALGQALAVLEQLQATGRQVGVISHVEALKEAIGIQLQVTRLGGGRSRVALVTG